MTDTDLSQQIKTGGIVSNTFGEHSLFAINRNQFQYTDACTVFRSYFDASLFKKDMFYIIAGTDGGLLYQYIKTMGIPTGSRYLFLELPEVLTLLENMGTANQELAVVTGENWLARADEMKIQKYAYMDRLVLRRSLGVVHGHYNRYPPFWREIKNEYNAYTRNVHILLNTRPFTNCQLINLTENQLPATCLIDAFKNKTAVVLAGGPSLDELLPWVQQHRQNLLVIAVSRISNSLLQADIQPDISVSIDPQSFNLHICKDMLKFQKGTLLVNSHHLSPNLLASWGGQKVFTGPRYPWTTPLQPTYIEPSEGETVTNAALTIAVQTGVAQIILGGADFCFNQEGFTHASGSAEHAIGPMPQQCEQLVETNSGMMADTNNGLMESGMSINLQAQFAAEQGCQIINPAPGAMRLPHIKYLPISLIQVPPQEKTARDIIAACLPANDKVTLIRLYKEELSEVDRIMKELRVIKELASKGLNYNDKIRSEEKSGCSAQQDIDPSKANKVNHIEEQLRTKYTDTVDFIKRYNMARLTAILRLELGKLDDDIQNNRIYFQALINSSDELLEILRSARTRILNRLEEEKPHPKLQRIFDQWSRDEQPGRAILWARQHKNYINQLPVEQQQMLREFHDGFDDTVEKLGQQYNASIEKRADLNGIPGKAREYLLCQDKSGLSRLLASLKNHNNKKQAAQLIILLQAHLAELHNEPATAIIAYQSITEGPVYLDTLMRLFELHTRIHDLDSAREVLKTLSGISSVYSPMYADMLHATGDTDTAVEIYTNYLLTNPNDLNTMMKLGKLFFECKSSEGVEWVMNYILSKEPDNHMAHQILNEMGLSLANKSTTP